MSLVAIEALAVGIARTRQPLELLDEAFGVVLTRQLLQVVPNELIQALAQSLSFLSGACHRLLVDRKGYVHDHSICAHIDCVNMRIPSIGLTSATPQSGQAGVSTLAGAVPVEFSATPWPE